MLLLLFSFFVLSRSWLTVLTLHKFGSTLRWALWARPGIRLAVCSGATQPATDKCSLRGEKKTTNYFARVKSAGRHQSDAFVCTFSITLLSQNTKGCFYWAHSSKTHTWIDFMVVVVVGGGCPGGTLTAADNGISFSQMFPLIPIYKHFHSFSKMAALLVKLIQLPPLSAHGAQETESDPEICTVHCMWHMLCVVCLAALEEAGINVYLACLFSLALRLYVCVRIHREKKVLLD